MSAAAFRVGLDAPRFGGADPRPVYLGPLRGTRIPCSRAPVAGLPPPHWTVRAR